MAILPKNYITFDCRDQLLFPQSPLQRIPGRDQIDHVEDYGKRVKRKGMMKKEEPKDSGYHMRCEYELPFLVQFVKYMFASEDEVSRIPPMQATTSFLQPPTSSYL